VIQSYDNPVVTRENPRENAVVHELLHLLRRQMACDSRTRCASNQYEQNKSDKHVAEVFHAPNTLLGPSPEPLHQVCPHRRIPTSREKSYLQSTPCPTA